MDSIRRFELNPILVKELRSRMRGSRAFITLTVALVLLAAAGYSLYRLAISVTQYSAQPLSPQIGQVLFSGLVFIELMVIAAVTPSVTAAAISGEIEKQTYEMLQATPLAPGRILWGKLISALGYIFILIFAAVPLVSLVFLFGGVAVREMIKAIIILSLVAVMFGVIGLFTSAVFKRSGRATAAAYLIVLGLMFGPIFVAIGAGIMRQTDPPRWLMIPSPITALGSSLAPSVNTQNLSSMLWMLGSPIYWIMGSGQTSMDSIPRPVYHYSLPLFIGITLVLYLISARLIRPTRRLQFTWSEALLGLVLFMGFLGLILLGYSATANRYENILVRSEQQADGMNIQPAVEPPVVVPGSAEGPENPPADAAEEPVDTPTFTPYPYPEAADPTPEG